MGVRNVHALPALHQFHDVWASPKLRVKVKMDMHRAFIFPTVFSCMAANPGHRPGSGWADWGSLIVIVSAALSAQS
eukprot:361432-Chlamydomonas_euryale.AAC.12